MSKYNLTDILEQYKIGSGWTKDFDYYGMLRSGLAIKEDTPLEIMKDIVEDFTDVNYHREAAHLYDAIEAIEANDGDYDAGEDKIEDFQQEIMMTIKSQGMDDKGDDYWGKDLGSFMKKRMSEDKEPRDGVKSAAAKLGMKPKHVKEARVDRDVAQRIEGMLSIPLKRKFLDAFMDLWQDLIEEDPFYAEDVINHLNNEMHREIAGWEATGDRLAGMEEGAMQPGEADLESGETGNMDALTEEISENDIIKALKAANAQDYEIEVYMKSLKKAGDEFDDVDDYVEDFKNYVADKALQEHFSRFMKDYQ